jgi:hypothetical protein
MRLNSNIARLVLCGFVIGTLATCSIYIVLSYFGESSLPILVPLIFFLLVPLIALFKFRKKVFLFYKKYEIEIIITLFIIYPQYKAFDLKLIDILDIPILFFLLVLLIKAIMRNRNIELNHPLLLVFFLLPLGPFLSSINGGLIAFINSIKIQKNVIYYLIFASLLLTKKDKFTFSLKIFYVTVTISCIIAILQEVLYKTTGFIMVPSVDPGMYNYMFEGSFLRTPAFFSRLSPQFANMLCFTIPAVFVMIIAHKNVLFRRRILLGMLFMMCIALYFTFSRNSLISAFIGVLFGIVIMRPRYLLHLLILVSIIAIFVLTTGLLDEIVNSVNHEIREGGDFSIRLSNLRDGLTRMDNHIIFGRGFMLSNRYSLTVRDFDIHISFLQGITETGIMGFGIYIVLITLIIIHLANIMYTPAAMRVDNDTVTICKSLLSGFIAYLIQIQFEPFFLNPNFFLLAGLLIATTKKT